MPEPMQAMTVVSPVTNLKDAGDRHNALVNFVKELMTEGVDFGKIPGSDKPSLLKPGAEKLATFFGLVARFTELQIVEDWTGEQHNQEPFFYYKMLCTLYRGDQLVSECIASINSWESKYRYRNANRKCPICDKEAIIKGKTEYGGGWLCFAKKGGCGYKFDEDDKRILNQIVGQVANTAIYDSVNTLMKMVEKRALIGAVLIGINASEFFTQDIEEVNVGGWTDVTDTEKPAPKPVSEQVKARAQEAQVERVQAERIYTTEEIGADFDEPPLLDEYGNPVQAVAPKPVAGKPVEASKSIRADVNPETGEISKPKPIAAKAEEKKPASKPGELTISPEYVKGVLTYRKENDVEMVQFGKDASGKLLWKRATESCKEMNDKVHDAMLSLFNDPKTGRPNMFEVTGSLKRHFKVQYVKSLTWEQLAALAAARKYEQYDPRWYPEEAANQHAQDGHPEEADQALAAAASDQFSVRSFYMIPEGPVEGITAEEIETFVTQMEKLKDPSVLKPLMDGGLKISIPKHFSYFMGLADMLVPNGDMVVGSEDFNSMINYAIEVERP